jgi:hypothetical protein
MDVAVEVAPLIPTGDRYLVPLLLDEEVLDAVATGRRQVLAKLQRF